MTRRRRAGGLLAGGLCLALGFPPALAQNNPGPDLPGFTRAFLEVDEGKISYLYRQGRGPALMLLPGSFSDTRQWEGVIPELDPGWTLVLAEVRGHGRSWPPPARGSIKQFAADAMRIAAARKLDRFYVGGHSIGGMIALEMGRAWPERILGVLSVEGWTRHQGLQVFGQPANPTLTAEMNRAREAERQRVTGGWTGEQRQIFAQIWKRWDGTEFLRKTALPILEVWGDRGRATPPPEAIGIPERPNIELRWIAGASHPLPAEKPAELGRILAGFIRRLEAGAHLFGAPGLRLPAGGAADFSELPRLPGELITVFRAVEHEAGFNMHPYLAHFGGRFWAMWSSNRIRDLQAGQHVRYSTSQDGVNWSAPRMLTPREDEANMRYFARGFWIRGGELWALAAYDEAVRPLFGPSLELRGYRWSVARDAWDAPAVIARGTINNFPPGRLASGEWMMARRDQQMRITMAIGGVPVPGDWKFFPLPAPEDGARMDEPVWWTLPDGTLAAALRDNRKPGRLYRSFSRDQGRTWTPPVRTDFPDASAKFHVLRLRDGRYAMVSNPNPGGVRIPQCLSLSADGRVFTAMAVLREAPTVYRFAGKDPGYAGYHYAQLLEHEDSLYVIHAENMEDIRLLRIPLRALGKLQP